MLHSLVTNMVEDLRHLPQQSVATYQDCSRFSPTFPQLFVKGELIGGCDIITEMHQSDELKAVLLD